MKSLIAYFGQRSLYLASRPRLSKQLFRARNTFISTMSEIPRTMKALRLTRENETATPTLTLVREVSVPKPEAGQLLVRVHASPIHPSDLLNAQGGFPYTTYPRIPGRDFVGTVVEVGGAKSNQNDRFPLGTTVFGTSGNTIAFSQDGFHAEFAVVPSTGVARVPTTFSAAAAATLGVPWTTAALALERTRASKGETVLVLGANGAVGSAAAHLAEARGCKVLKGVRGTGGDVDTKADPSLERINEITEGKGVDVVVDTVGAEELTSAAVTRLGLDGRLVFVAGKGEMKIDMRQFYRLGKSIVGCNSLNETIERMGSRLREMASDGSFDGLDGDKLESAWEKTTLEDAVEAYHKAAEDKKRKFVITMQ